MISLRLLVSGWDEEGPSPELIEQMRLDFGGDELAFEAYIMDGGLEEMGETEIMNTAVNAYGVTVFDLLLAASNV